jgi:hypothetical protein
MPSPFQSSIVLNVGDEEIGGESLLVLMKHLQDVYLSIGSKLPG